MRATSFDTLLVMYLCVLMILRGLTFEIKLLDVFQRIVDKVETSKSLERQRRRYLSHMNFKVKSRKPRPGFIVLLISHFIW